MNTNIPTPLTTDKTVALTLCVLSAYLAVMFVMLFWKLEKMSQDQKSALSDTDKIKTSQTLTKKRTQKIREDIKNLKKYITKKLRRNK